MWLVQVLARASPVAIDEALVVRTGEIDDPETVGVEGLWGLGVTVLGDIVTSVVDDGILLLCAHVLASTS